MTGLEPALADLVRRLALAVGLPGPARAAPPATFDWERWLDLAREHDVLPLLAVRAADDLPADVLEALRTAHTRWAHETLFRAAELRAVLDRLAPVGDVIVLKGPAMVATVYGDAAERVASDLDLLVRDRTARRAAVAALATRGYLPPDGGDDGAHDLALHSPVAELDIDVHVDLTRPPRADGVLADAWARRVTLPVLGGIDALCPSWRALHAAVHALADPIGSPLLRNLLETGWLAATLTTAERSDLVALARRAGVTDRVALALALAHRLFGSPALLGDPRPSSRAWWAWRRLGWQYGAASGLAGTVEHVAEYHLRRLDAGRYHDLDPRPLIATIAEVIAGHLTGAARTAVDRLRPPAVTRAVAAVEPLGDDLLVHAIDTGDVHVLTGDAVEAWDATATAGSETALRDRLDARGVPPERAAAAIDVLLDSGLLVPAD